MLKTYDILEGRISPSESEEAPILVYINPSDGEKALLTGRGIGEHNLVSALDPDELSRIEFEEGHVAVIFKRPRNYSSEDNFLFRVCSAGFFLFPDRLVVVMMEDLALFDRKIFEKLVSVREVFLKILFRFVHHFFEHLKVIQMVTDALEQKISTAMENRYLLNLFTLEKSLVYYLNALQANTMVIERIRIGSAKLSLLEPEMEFLEDLTIENQQCFKMAEIYSSILASMMDARASIVNNNLNVLMKNLTLVMLGFAVCTFVVSAFSMNVPLPFRLGDKLWSFWFVMGLVMSVIIWFVLFLKKKKW